MLAQDLLGSDGQVLLRKGTVLTPKIRLMLANRGHTEIVILAPQQGLAAEEICARLDAMFENTQLTPCMLELRALFEQFHTREKLSE